MEADLFEKLNFVCQKRKTMPLKKKKIKHNDDHLYFREIMYRAGVNYTPPYIHLLHELLSDDIPFCTAQLILYISSSEKCKICYFVQELGTVSRHMKPK